jgi:hypothetical protein
MMKEAKESALPLALIQVAGRLSIPLLSSAVVGTVFWMYQKWVAKKKPYASPADQPVWLGI